MDEAKLKAALAGEQVEAGEQTPLEEVFAFYAREGLKAPYIPAKFQGALITLAPGEIWTTDRNKTIGDPLSWACEAIQSKAMSDMLALGYKNGSIHYYVKQGPLVFVLERQWGGFSLNKPEDVNAITASASIALKNLDNAKKLDPNKRLILVDSDKRPLESGYLVVNIRELDSKKTWTHSTPQEKDFMKIRALALSVVDYLK